MVPSWYTAENGHFLNGLPGTIPSNEATTMHLQCGNYEANSAVFLVHNDILQAQMLARVGE